MSRSETLSPLRPRGRSGWAAAVVAVGTLAVTLAGCAGSGGGKSAASSSAPAKASPTKAADLARGLLPADAFGSGAAVTSITVQQLQQGTGLGGGSLQGAQITPPACAALVKSTQPQAGDQLKGAAAEVAKEGSSATLEMLAVSDKAKELASGVDAAIAACPQAQLTLPQGGSATISFQKVDVPQLGDGSAAVSFTTVATPPGGQQVSVPALVGFAVDGDRLVTLLSLDPQGAAPDPATFTALLQKAYQVQKDKLG